MRVIIIDDHALFRDGLKGLLELRSIDVAGVAADDVLNVRIGPGVSAEVIATLDPDVTELESTGRVAHLSTALWREIVIPGNGTGWVNAAFLTESAGGE